LSDIGLPGSLSGYLIDNKSGVDAITTLGRGQYAPNLMPVEGAQSARVSNHLLQGGIPGIKYLDAGSRPFTPPTVKDGPSGAELYWGNDPRPVGTFPTRQEAEEAARQLDTRSRNYVVFDDKLVTILKRYGWVPGTAVPAGVMAQAQADYEKQEGRPVQTRPSA
jgi:hypothetical protein